MGIVTLEDILEELVGEIWDEHDEESVLYGKIADGEYWADGKCDLGEFLGLYGLEEDEDCESNTRRRLGDGKVRRHSAVGEVVRYGGVEIKVVKAAKQKVLKVRSARRSPNRNRTGSRPGNDRPRTSVST